MISLPSSQPSPSPPLSLSLRYPFHCFLFFDLRLSLVSIPSSRIDTIEKRHLHAEQTRRLVRSTRRFPPRWLLDSLTFQEPSLRIPERSLGTFVVTKRGTEGTSPSRVYLFANRFFPSLFPPLLLPHGRISVYIPVYNLA